MVPTCGASRASLMTGIRPSPSRFVSYLTWAEKDASEAVPLNKHFLNNGYRTVSLGKVFHHSSDCAEGWSDPVWRSKKPSYQDAAAKAEAIRENKREWPQKRKHNSTPFEHSETPDAEYRDGDCADKAISYLEEFASEQDQPFFLAVGFQKPHLPFNAPQKYWDLYDRSTINLPENYYPPTDAPEGAVHNSGELRAYAGIHPKRPVDAKMGRNLIHGYYACVSFIDAQIGRLMDALEEQGLKENTIICLWGDHGWQLGEHGMWNKHSCFETSMHTPLIITCGKGVAAKGQNSSRVSSLVEFIDIYPTLCQLAGLTIPPHCEGQSLSPLMEDAEAPWKEFAVGRFGKGDTIRSNTHRYSEYSDRGGKKNGQMLYNHLNDADENTNVALLEPGNAKELEKQLERLKGR